ncbi:hypothetical protein VTL71DRAFT_8773 [Oculimacula yallundae]|uniref:Peptidase C14 caspase domain-containing protein n=1 Tax=Oculimacula yallundae TaxID=86028 RepID=A0ABR4D042_9HELO
MASTAIYPSFEVPKKKAIHCLLIYNEHDDTGCMDWTDTLKDVLNKSYEIESIKVFVVPSTRSQLLTVRAIRKLRDEHLDSSSVLFVFYSGHGDVDDRGRLYLPAYDPANPESPQTPPPSLDWQTLQEELIRTPSDVLIMLDCCHAGAAAEFGFGSPSLERAEGGGERGNIELFMSCRKDEVCFGGDDSFTSLLIGELEYSATPAGWTSFTIKELEDRMTEHIGDVRAESGGADWEKGEYQHMRMPVFKRIQRRSRSSIWLTPKKITEVLQPLVTPSDKLLEGGRGEQD